MTGRDFFVQNHYLLIYEDDENTIPPVPNARLTNNLVTREVNVTFQDRVTNT